ncbi:MAG: ABC transporter ATP-binding protein [Candidatus Wolfebacteria bacterium]|nr:ABC transporter ATP-binding protein [Candidatus Wolfebacteria bacterium]
MENISQNRKATLNEILKAFWLGIKPQKWAFYTCIIAFSAVSVFQLIIPLFYKKFFDALALGGDRAAVVPQLIHFILIVLVLNAFSWLSFRIGLFTLDNFEANTMARLRRISYNYLLGHSYGFFLNNFSGALVQRIGRFSRAFEKLFDTIVFNIITLAINMAGVIIVVWFQSRFIAIAMLSWAVITMTGNYIFSRWKLKYDLRSAASDSATTAFLADTIANQATISSFTGTGYESVSFKDVSQKQANATRLAWDLSAVLDAVQAAFVVVIEFVVFYYGIKFWEQGVITIGTFVLIQAYLIGLINRLWNFSRVVRNIYEGLADSEEMVGILNTAHEVQDIPGAKPLKIKENEIVFKNVSFSFANQRPVLTDINLRIHGGEKIAVIGPSGAGKSTLVRLIMRLYNLKQGKISIDNQDIQNVTQESLREAVSIVPQDPMLFHRTLLENIRYGRRGATDEEVFVAAKLAHCDEFIDNLPLKYDTFVGERGIKLSGGERQRVAIARAILKNAPVLILDEATSSLDSHSESLIQDALNKLMEGKTTIVIAHRLSTIRKMNRIVVIQNGAIVEEGTHDELIKKDESLYKYLWTLQAGGFLA